ncbi:MAG: hypothetical protein V1729_03900 [Candidatus Woesearchaeota archaeon]
MDSALLEKIKRTYSKRHSTLLISGQSQRATALGYWAASDPTQLFELFKKVRLQNFKKFLDLGSGDGIAVAVASLFTDASGIEIDAELHKEAKQLTSRLGLHCTLKCKDYLDEDLSAYDFIFINPDNYFHRLEKKLVEEFKGTLVIVDNIFRPLTLDTGRSLSVAGVSYSRFLL